jgi:hypothetical protein
MQVPRLVSPLTNPNGWIAAAGAVLAVVVMVNNAVHGRGAFDATALVSAAAAVAALISRQYVTPVADPRDGNGNPLTAAPPVPPAPAARP